MSRSAEARARSARRLLALPAALLFLGVPAAHADGGPAEIVATPAADDPVNFPILDLNANVQELSAPAHDLSLSTENSDGSVKDTDAADERVVTLAADVLFAFDEAELSGDARTTLEQAADILREEAQGATVHIDGYTDARGSDQRNAELSQERADAVETELAALLHDSGITFAAEGHGAADPVAPDEIDGEDNPEGRAENRRVEIHFPQ